MKILTPLFLLLAFCAAPCPAAGPTKAETAARELSLRISSAPARTAELFDGKFFQRVPLAYLEETLAGLYSQAGAVTGIRAENLEGDLSGRFVFSTAGGYDIPCTLGLDAQSGRIRALFFKAPYKRDVTLAGVETALAALPGRVGLLALRYGVEPLRLAGLNEDEYFAIGSVFKLYVLGAMLEEQVPWTRVYRLADRDKSLPSGRLQDWPSGAPLTAYALAAMMISESDNTAADMLISAVGRRRIEARLPALGHSDPAQMTPFLRTSELFRLRSDTAAALKYLNLPAGEKYGWLEKLDAPLDAAKLGRGPFGVKKIEWNASPSDVCAALDYFRQRGGDEALALLGINKGGLVPPGFSYAGFKGGSEAGVLSGAWLLRRGESDWYCLAASWNSDKDDLDEKEFFGLMQSALRALASVK
jgi:hypothetical protein